MIWAMASSTARSDSSNNSAHTFGIAVDPEYQLREIVASDRHPVYTHPDVLRQPMHHRRDLCHHPAV